MADQASHLSDIDIWRKLNARKGALISKDIDEEEFIWYWSNLYKSEKQFRPEEYKRNEQPWVSVCDLEEILERLPKRKAPGPDGITNEILML